VKLSLVLEEDLPLEALVLGWAEGSCRWDCVGWQRGKKGWLGFRFFLVSLG